MNDLPDWTLSDPQPHNTKDDGPRVSLSIADGWPTALMNADKAEQLGKQLIDAARAARNLAPTP